MRKKGERERERGGGGGGEGGRGGGGGGREGGGEGGGVGAEEDGEGVLVGEGAIFEHLEKEGFGLTDHPVTAESRAYVTSVGNPSIDI